MSLLPLLERSGASDQLKLAIRALAAQPWGNAQSCETIVCHRGMPAVKVARVFTQLFTELPDTPIHRVELNASSGCSDFGGQLTLHTDDGIRVFDFVWDCRWRAAEEGWTDHWGEPDQIRAAREFGWLCFSVWSERTAAELGVRPSADAPNGISRVA